MKITSLVENTSNCHLPVEHGLSLYIELDHIAAQSKDNSITADNQSCNAISENQNCKLKILFDMGQGDLFAQNAAELGISIEDIDLAVISHGHYDHGGGLETFLKLNGKAPVYIHSQAFEPHYSLKHKERGVENLFKYIGLNTSLLNNNRLVFCGNAADTKNNAANNSISGTHYINAFADNYMLLFSDVKGECCNPSGNRLLFEKSTQNENGNSTTTNNTSNTSNHTTISSINDAISHGYKPDAFKHEQNLLIKEGKNLVLFAGCAHSGIINIMRKAEQIAGFAPTHVFAGMHLAKSKSATTITAKETAAASPSANKPATSEDLFINTLAQELQAYTNTKYYTMHCTGTEQFQKLRQLMGNQIEYLSGGESTNL